VGNPDGDSELRAVAAPAGPLGSVPSPLDVGVDVL